MTVPTSQLRAALAASLSHMHGNPSKPVGYQDFLPAAAADWMADAIGHPDHDPYALDEKAAS